MASPNGIAHSEQTIHNSSFDEDFGISFVEPLGYDGKSLQRMNADNMQIYSVSDSGYTYFCFAAPGTARATAKWKVFQLDAD